MRACACVRAYKIYIYNVRIIWAFTLLHHELIKKWNDIEINKIKLSEEKGE